MDMEKKTSHRHCLLSAIDGSTTAGKKLAIGRGWQSLVYLARTSIVALISRISVGKLKVLTPGEVYEFGAGGGLTGELKVVSDMFWVRMLLQGDLGFAEAYMFGDVVCNDLWIASKILEDTTQSLCANVPAVRKRVKLHGKDISDEEIFIFKRKWEYYFTYYEAGFATKTLGDVLITVGRENTLALLDDVPL